MSCDMQVEAKSKRMKRKATLTQVEEELDEAGERGVPQLVAATPGLGMAADRTGDGSRQGCGAEKHHLRGAEAGTAPNSSVATQ